MEWMFLPLKRYAEFDGRSRRLEYWMFSLMIFLASLVWVGIFAVLGGLSASYDDMSGPAMLWIVIGLVMYLGILVPGIAVTVRRFHDRDMSGWFILLNFIPYVGGLIVFVFMLLPGTPGPNRYGPDPKQPEGLVAAF